MPMRLTVEVEPEEDGRWLAEVPDFPGVLAYGTTRPEAIARAQALCLACWPIASSTAKTCPRWAVFSVAHSRRPRPSRNERWERQEVRQISVEIGEDSLP